MKKGILLFLLFISVLSNAQNAQDIIDGLKKDLKTNIDDKKRATIYSDLTWYYSNISLDSAMVYGKKAIIESTKLKDSTLIAQVYSDVGAVYFKKGDFNASEKSYLQAYKIRKIKQDFEGLAKINANLANVYQTQERYSPAMKANLESLTYFKNMNNIKNVNIIKGNIANLLFKMRDYKKAIIYANEAINYQLENNLSNDLCKTYVTKGNILLNLSDTINSQKSYNLALKYCNEVGDKYASSSIYNNLSIIKAAQKKKIEAEELYQKAKTERKILNSDLNSAKLEFNLIDKLIFDKKFVQAKIILNELKQFFIQKESTINILNVYKKLIPVCSNLNQKDSVLFYSDSYINLFEELLQKNAIKQTAELETKYQTEKKEKLILKQQAEAKQKNIWLLLISSLAIIGLLLFRQQKLNSRQQQQQAQFENELLKEQSNFKIQEQRLGISRELHDSVGSQLTFIISILDNLKSAPVKLENTLEKKIDNLSGYANNSISELRDTIWALNSDNLTIAELETRILNFIKDASESIENINFNFKNKVQNNHQLTSRQGINLFRVLQETVNNAIKHSNANKITVVLDENNNQVSMKIQDNGKGFDYEEKKKKSYGLSNIKNRIEELDGILQVESNEKGTLIEISIPL